MMVKFFDHGQGEAAPAVKYLIEEVVVDYDQYRQPKRDAVGRIKRVRRSISPEVLKGHPERMIDLVCSTIEEPMGDEACRNFKRTAFLAILDEEVEAGRCDEGLIESIRSEVLDRMR